MKGGLAISCNLQYVEMTELTSHWADGRSHTTKIEILKVCRLWQAHQIYDANTLQVEDVLKVFEGAIGICSSHLSETISPWEPMCPGCIADCFVKIGAF